MNHTHFIEDFWTKNSSLWGNHLVTRFPPEPNGRLHLGHARSIWLNYTLAKKHGGKMHLRMDDTNPEKEDITHEHGIIETLNALGIEWDGPVRYASDYFHAMHDVSVHWISNGLAFVDTSAKENIRTMRGDLYNPGTRSPDALKPVAWHLDMFRRMKNGDFPDGGPVLRAKIDMHSPNINLRDPVLYRIKHMEHARTKKAWCIYPTYDFAHPFSDSMEGIALSLCTLEFEDHRPLYDWICEHVRPYIANPPRHKPVELEFSRLEITNGLTSKRKINALVENGKVDGWDDPRLFTLEGLFRRGFPKDVVLKFIEDCGIGRSNGEIPFSRLEDTLRLELDTKSHRRVTILDPVALDIDNLELPSKIISVANHPKNETMGHRDFGLSTRVWVDRDDIRMDGLAEKGFKRIEPGACVRLMNMGIVTVKKVETDEHGKVCKVHAVSTPENKPRSTIHALSRDHAIEVKVMEPSVMGPESNPDDCMHVYHAMVEPNTMNLDETFHAPRVGYFTVDVKRKDCLILTTRLKKGF
jgi:glutaminyl-tRNA synthetase